MFNTRRKRKHDVEQLEIINRPKSVISEQFRTLRTNILFTSSDKTIQRVMVTSSEPGEGKSTISANTAVAFAQAGYKTLLIDADMRKPTQHKIFGVMNSVGLSTLIAGHSTIDDVIRQTETTGLNILTSGPVPPNPAELLTSTVMTKMLDALDEQYDLILMDTSPVLAVTDAKIIAEEVDGCLLVVNAKNTHRDKIRDAKNELQKSGANIIGVVMNELDMNDEGSNYYYYADK